ncbi:hypothetical protein RhiirA5_506873 [Rhizophagus irregularis]|uniref:Protein kinase domain-containing protein n=1 Tax=Rhizophagus irregularis TaxID=588596 RepID=A0A2N0NQ58_9GLOM|nr:hypothetical protein RhiirA5_506873 [Rhizophagus irregularis]
MFEVTTERGLVEDRETHFVIIWKRIWKINTEIVHKDFIQIVHQNSIKLADFGLGKNLEGINSSGKEERLKKSDYTVLERYFGFDSFLAERIAQGLTEVIVEGALDGYSDLYSISTDAAMNKNNIFTYLFRVLDYDPNKRPTTQGIVNTLLWISQPNLLSFNSNNNEIEFNEALEPSDI